MSKRMFSDAAGSFIFSFQIIAYLYKSTQNSGKVQIVATIKN